MPLPPALGSLDRMMNNKAKYIFLMPAVVWVLLFTLFPLVYSFSLSLTNYRMGRNPKYIGFDNYAEILGIGEEKPDKKAISTASFSAFLFLGSTAATLLFGTFVAWVFNHNLPFLRQMRAIITMPLFAAPIALGWLGVVIFNEQAGPINNILQGVGLPRINWFIEPMPARFAVMFTDVWQWTPFVFIIVLAAMQAVPDDLYESARLDTKSNWTVFRMITFPMIAPALGTVMLLRMVESLKIIDIPYSLTRGGPGSVTQTYVYYAYEKGLIGSFQLGEAAALAYLLVIVAIVISSIYFYRVRERFA